MISLMHVLELLIILLLSEQNVVHLNHPGETSKIWEEESAGELRENTRRSKGFILKSMKMLFTASLS